MGIIETVFRTMTCDTCKKTVTFDKNKPEEVVKENPWVMGGRFIQTGDARAFWYCSDLCEVEGLKTEQHNVAQPKKVVSISEAGPDAIRRAAEAAARLEEANRALKAGEPATLNIQG